MFKKCCHFPEVLFSSQFQIVICFQVRQLLRQRDNLGRVLNSGNKIIHALPTSVVWFQGRGCSFRPLPALFTEEVARAHHKNSQQVKWILERDASCFRPRMLSTTAEEGLTPILSIV